MKFFNKKQANQQTKVNFIETEDGLGNTTNNNGGPKKCIGCGKEMQSTDDRKPGYALDIKKQNLCMRCFKMKYYNKFIEQDINDKDFIAILEEINDTKETIRYYYVIDIFDLPGSRLEWLENLISKKEVVIVINKIDLLPKVVDKEKVYKYIKAYFGKSPLKDAKIILTSSVKKEYTYALYEQMMSVTYDQYIIGVSNAGKSSLLNACLYLNGQDETIVTSKYTNTTLDKIKINFTKENSVYDTPGLVKHNHIAIVTQPSYWDYFFFRKEVKQVTFQLMPGQSIFYGAVAWISFESGERIVNGKHQKTSFHFYVNRQMPLHRTKAANSMNYYKKNMHNLSPRLINPRGDFDTVVFEFSKSEKVDLHISGLGWVSFTTYPGLKLKVYVPKVEYKIKVNLLPALI